MDATVATTISSLNSLFGIAGSLLGGVLCAQMWRRKTILIGAIVLYILAGFGITFVSSSGLIVVLALAAGALYFIPIAAQSTIMIETKQPFDPTILGGAASISSGIGQLLCLVPVPGCRRSIKHDGSLPRVLRVVPDRTAWCAAAARDREKARKNIRLTTINFIYWEVPYEFDT